MKRSLFITNHAVDRYQQRVRASATRLEAVAEMRRIVAGARSRSRPRWWTRVAGERPGCRYLYWADAPHVCLVVRGDAVITVFSRRVCSAWRAGTAPVETRPALTVLRGGGEPARSSRQAAA